MKPTIPSLLLAAGLLAPVWAAAATIPTSIAEYSEKSPIQTLKTKATSWRDPAFGDMGWTHNSAWGTFQAQKGQTVTITAIAGEAGLHPGITVWFRGKRDTAPDNYVADHFYAQNANQFVLGASDEKTGSTIGNIVMKAVKYGYDQDGNKQQVADLNGAKDGVPGQLELSFTAPQTGNYLFVLGGFNPDAGIDTATPFGVDTEVQIADR